MGPEAQGGSLRTEGRAQARTRGRPARSHAVPPPSTARPASSSFAGHGKEARAGVGSELMVPNLAQDARCCVTLLLSMSPEEQMLRAAVLPPDVLAGGLLTNLQSTAVLRHGFNGCIFSLRTQEQPDLQTMTSGVLPGSGHPPRVPPRPDRPVGRAPTRGLRGHTHPGTGKGLPHGGARSHPGRPRGPDVGAVSAAA